MQKRSLRMVCLRLLGLMLLLSGCGGGNGGNDSSVSREATYTVSDLGSLVANDVRAMSLNNKGEVVGYSLVPDPDDNHAFLYTGGKMQDIGRATNSLMLSAYDINDAEQILGSFVLPNHDRNRDCLYDHGKFTDLSNQPYAPYVINAGGQIAGIASGHVGLYSNGTWQDLGSPPASLGVSKVVAMNNRGDIVGNYVAADQTQHAFVYLKGAFQDVGPLQGRTSSIAIGISDAGQVVAYAFTPPPPHEGPVSDPPAAKSMLLPHSPSGRAVPLDNGLSNGPGIPFVWDANRGALPLPTLTSMPLRALAANHQGDVVGDGGGRIFLWHQGRGIEITSLINGLGDWRNPQIQAVNDRGQIVGRGYRPDLKYFRSFLLTPK